MIRRTMFGRVVRWLSSRTASGRGRLRRLDAATLWPALYHSMSAIQASANASLYCNSDPAWRYPAEWLCTPVSPAEWFAAIEAESTARANRKREEAEERAAKAEAETEARMREARGRPCD